VDDDEAGVTPVKTGPASVSDGEIEVARISAVVLYR
jgi:hypothetical protein